jgi:hypothetical protein
MEVAPFFNNLVVKKLPRKMHSRCFGAWDS